MSLIKREVLREKAIECGTLAKQDSHLLVVGLGYVLDAPTIDPIRAAGGCRCGECRWGQQDDLGVMHCHKYHIHKKPGGYCDDGEPREAQDDG